MFQRILVPLDGTPDAEEAIAIAKMVDQEFSADVTLLLVSPTESALLTALGESFGASGSVAAAVEQNRTMQELGEVYLSGVRDEHGDDSWTFRVEAGDPAVVIAEVAAEIDADLIVMASHARSGLKRVLMGSVAEDVLRRAKRPVLVVPIDNED